MNQATRELQIIGELQQKLLPRPLPRLLGWQIAAHFEVGATGGGDYYDILQMDDDHVAIVIADVSGHGPAAAILTSMIRMLLHSCPITSGRRRAPYCPVEVPCQKAPHEILMHLNQTLLENSLDDQFMTMIFAIVNLKTGQLQFSNAGHSAPWWLQVASGTLVAFPNIGGIPLGVDVNAYYETAILQLSPGDLVIFYTDGLTDLQDRDGSFYGSERLQASIHAAGNDTAEAMKSSLVSHLHEFLSDSDTHDDLTLFILKRTNHGRQLPSEQYIG